MENQRRKKILSEPSYWIEKSNMELYSAILEYMHNHRMKRTDLATHLNLSKGRVSQILNDGDINFSLNKIVEIAISIGKYPILKFEDHDAYHEDENANFSQMITFNKDELTGFNTFNFQNDKCKVIPITASLQGDLETMKFSVNG